MKTSRKSVPAKSGKKTARKGGRPSLYTEALDRSICSRIANGESLVNICLTPGHPCRDTVLDWLQVHEGFSSRYAQAREAQADYMDHKILAVADACTPETALADRIKIGAYQWRASKLKPRVYGDKLDVQQSGNLTVNVVTGVPEPGGSE